MTPSLHGIRQAAATPTASVAQVVAEENQPIDDSALRRTWKTFINDNPTEKLLVAAMSYCNIELQNNTDVVLTVGSEEQKQRIVENQDRILPFLRQQLHNTHIRMGYIVNQTEATHRAFTPREKMEVIRKAHPETVTALIEAFGLELS